MAPSAALLMGTCVALHSSPSRKEERGETKPAVIAASVRIAPALEITLGPDESLQCG